VTGDSSHDPELEIGDAATLLDSEAEANIVRPATVVAITSPAPNDYFALHVRLSDWAEIAICFVPGEKPSIALLADGVHHPVDIEDTIGGESLTADAMKRFLIMAFEKPGRGQ
jgi:hypothetical protein